MLKILGLSIKFLWREWRAGEWTIVFVALLLAITATTSVHFYLDRVMRGLDLQQAKFLGGELVISSPLPIPSLWEKAARKFQLRTAQVWTYPSMISYSHGLQMVNLQAVSSTYPLIDGRMEKIARHTIWAEPRLLTLLNIRLNDTVTIGNAKFRVAKKLTADLETLNTGWNIAPRVLMPLDEVAATGTVIPGSRVDYRLLLVGQSAQLEQFKQWIKPRLLPSQRILALQDQQNQLTQIIGNAGNYLELVLLVCLLISGVAIALSIKLYLQRHMSHVALWRCVGANRQQILGIFLWQLLIIASIAGILGIAVGYCIQILFANLFNQFLQFSLPSASIAPILLGWFTSVFILFAFSYPVIQALPRISPLFLWRQETSTKSWSENISLVATLLITALVVAGFLHYSKVTVLFIGGLFLCILLIYGLGLVLLKLLHWILPRFEGVFRRGISQLVQNPKAVNLQFTGFTLIGVFLVTLSALQTYLLDKWQNSLPQRTPNYFAINIAPQDLTDLQHFFTARHIAISGIYPMLRGRLIEKNSKPILSVIPPSAANNNALHRELNLSWMWKFPTDNKVVEGEPWSKEAEGKPLVSIEKQLATDLQLHLGDTLTFQIGEKQQRAIITNLRTLDWSSFHPNFFMIFPPGLFKQFAATYITSFYLQPQQTNIINTLVQRFPNITVIDVANLLQQMQRLIDKIVQAMEYLFLFALAIGILIFIVSLQASMQERHRVNYLLRVLGASKKYIYSSALVEFVCLGLMVMITALVLSQGLIAVFKHYLFA